MGGIDISGAFPDQYLLWLGVRHHAHDCVYHLRTVNTAICSWKHKIRLDKHAIKIENQNPRTEKLVATA